MNIRTLFQFCDYCKAETVFNYETVTCIKCNNKSKNFKENETRNKV